MPSTSAKQAKFMRAVAHSPEFAKKVGVSQSVGKDFEMADKKKRKFGSGGKAEYPIRLDLSKVGKGESKPAKPITQRDLDRHARLQGEEAGESKVMKRAKGGKCYADGGMTAAPRRSLRGPMPRGAMGMGRPPMGAPMGAPLGARRPMPAVSAAPAVPAAKKGGTMKKSDKAGRALVKKSADTEGRAMKKFAKGGSIDGIAKKGKTKGKMC